MATAPDLSAEAADTDANEEVAPVDFEARAREMGWTAEDEFKGDKTRWVDAETFVKRGEEMMPILKAHNKKLERELADLRKQFGKASEHFSKAEERAYNRALADLEKRREEAVADGDLEAFRQVDKEARDLAADRPSAAKVDVDPAERAEMFADWSKANKWYGTNAALQSYADAQASLMAQKKGGVLDRDDLDAVSEKVREKFAEDFPEAFGAKAAAPRPRASVEGVSPARRTNGYSYSDLPPEAKRVCDKWVASGIVKSKEDYVKSFDFKGYSNGR